MPVIMPDTSAAEELSNIEPGTYPATIVSAVPKTSKEKGTPMLEVTFNVNVGGKERTRKTWVMTAGPGSFNFDTLLRAVHQEQLADEIKARPGQVAFDTDVLTGQLVQVVIETELYQGQQRDRVKTYLPA